MKNYQTSATTGSGKITLAARPLFRPGMSTIVDLSQNKPLEELRKFVEGLERQEAERKAKENQKVLEAAARYVLDE